MKKYCLSSKGKEDLLNFTAYICVVIIITYITITIFGMVVIMVDESIPKNTDVFKNIVYYNGFVGYIFVIVYCSYSFIKWLKSSIVEC